MSQEHKQIQLQHGRVALVDSADFDLVRRYRWRLHQLPHGTYVLARVYTSGQIKRVYMHRLILGLTNPLELADHINGDGLDNRRSNLRVANRSENACNSGKRVNNTSGFKGVSFFKRYQRFRATICVNGKQVHIGYYDTAEVAARAYDARAIEVHGAFAYLNFKEA
jgi:hypothetical protein